jgi:hypothetical protein
MLRPVSGRPWLWAARAQAAPRSSLQQFGCPRCAEVAPPGQYAQLKARLQSHLLANIVSGVSTFFTFVVCVVIVNCTR